MEIVPPEEFDEEPVGDAVTEEYERFRDREGIPVHTGLYVEDLNALETGPWARTGQRGALVNLYGMQGVMDIHVHEIAEAERTTQQRHVYDEIVFVAAGNGLTRIGEAGVTFEWDENSLFYVPKNVPYEHVNVGDGPARLVSHTSLPYLLSGLKDPEFIFDCDHQFVDLDSAFYAAEGSPGTDLEDEYEGFEAAPTWDANFIPDVTKFEHLQGWDRMGTTDYVRLLFEDSIIASGHIVEYRPGVYHKGHRHGPGANVHYRSGAGYTLTWKDGWDQCIKLDLQAGSLITPPPGWYHQHFVTERTRQLAVHSPSLGTLKDHSVFDPFEPSNVVEFTEEEAQFRELYRAELDAVGTEFRMPEAVYEDPHADLESLVSE